MKTTSRRTRFATTIPRNVKRVSGRTSAERTPIAIRTTGVELTDDIRAYANRRMSTKLAKFAKHIERLTVRLEDVNGPRGGIDTQCRVKVVLAGLGPVVYEAIGREATDAIDLAATGTERAVRKTIRRAGASIPRVAARRMAEAPQVDELDNPPPRTRHGSFIGRRVGHARSNLEDALARPEKLRRDALVDTAAPEVSASDRRAGGPSTARRNSRRNDARATSMLEDSARARPSRKSTRRSANRSKRDSNLKRRQTRATTAPGARAARAQARDR
jgi:ribosome-associated translation inhibitor RaiA